MQNQEFMSQRTARNAVIQQAPGSSKVMAPVAKLSKRILKRTLGPRLIRILTTGMETLRYYPQYLRNGEAGRLHNLDIEITYNCNARCRMCPLYGEHMDQSPLPTNGRSELSTEALRNVLLQCAQMGTTRVLFTGGEPLLRPDLPGLVEFGSSLGMSIGMNTNGLGLTKDRVRQLIAVGLDTLNVSIDGPGAVHDSIRRVPNMLARIDENVLGLRAEQARQNRSNPTLSAACTVSALNQSCLHELVPIAARWRACLSLSPVFFELGADDRSPLQTPAPKPESWFIDERIRNIDPDVLSRELGLVRRLSRECGVPLVLGLSQSPRYLRQRYYSASYCENNKCLYPWYGTRMNAYGDIFPCSLQTFMGNVLQKSLQDIWNSPRYTAFRRSLRSHGLFKRCARCCAISRDDWIGYLLPRFPRLLSRGGKINGSPLHG
jgi:radical SAM protein with 4Fe4S-binding SPASM domain